MLDLEDAKLKKRSVTISGHRTSISIEQCFWRHLKRYADTDKISLNEIVRQIDEARSRSLSGSIRAYVIQRLETESTQKITTD
ncbi:ribbon-helix-helix domain-containing protein [Kordiimonas sp. SCSIO 12610]|uniref:ribbon-helix-helix domain-containing protein n=1 Tax=Kordiimonas sp. SCSIO 12610 TaxID=2829597 RepID=UPI00210AFFD7|nr:ribbon-helix-helix domain-containing protein [Kordiimonas sp. SCSIO 12610]UTW54437.1 ribbon-helix-helix domain-containing protein [Kordiimonas sp. SCSIO 12610]